VIGLVYSNLEQRNKKKEDGKKESDTKLQIPGLKLEVRKSASVNKKERYSQKKYGMPAGVWKMHGKRTIMSKSRVNAR